MTHINGHEQEQEQERAKEAWAKMEERLRQEPVNPTWATWDARSAELDENNKTLGAVPSDRKIAAAVGADAQSVSQPSRSTVVPMPKKNRKIAARLAAAAAAAAIVITAVTPAGNSALAGILNKFTMQDVVLIQETELDNMIQMVYDAGESTATESLYGTFTSTGVGNFSPDATAEEIRDELGYTPIIGPDGEKGSLNASVGTQTEMRLNVTAVNETLNRLGADHLFPQEADNKAITLTYPASVYYDFHENDDNWAVLSQSETPSVEFDESFPVEETMNAVINFPYLPQDLKKSLQQAAVSSGKLPLPLYANGKAQSMDVSGVKVTYTQGDSYSRTAFWMKDGQLFEFNAQVNFKGGEEGFLNFVKGLAAQ
ncbi:hypothetical protein [Saccharibacillus kuerlensis]|uniref:DUF4367 domain-containing protein n=1 Tax=Saccharibacillus kuerlensis TaxID=459527 RepID=A0ABQ2L7T0_9BACL|nr:hypothetical protein [Saccharibacillus kuerlensis]GGO06110.1 hypothetical protein GCM10010969_33170 [Saccharibacillus kuerlensis]